ncbi:MAG: VTT domain-containing protein [Candidatus Methanoperedens sp.]|nr:VTT domain-containing protein [Candidatus Methanoperedens sp.]MCZ7394551.1 VTT domain-containing protein [Candidatus Methanoperedens sp.]
MVFRLFIEYGLMGLFGISVISSIIPIPTEFVIVALLRVGENPVTIIITLIVGSIIGASLGYLVGKYELQKLMPFHKEEREKEVHMHFRKYGAALLLVSPWIPLVGDLTPMVAGIENYETKKFLIVISVAKIIKSTLVVYLLINGIHWWSLFIK